MICFIVPPVGYILQKHDFTFKSEHITYIKIEKERVIKKQLGQT
jgi:hypothetical protein